MRPKRPWATEMDKDRVGRERGTGASERVAPLPGRHGEAPRSRSHRNREQTGGCQGQRGGGVGGTEWGKGQKGLPAVSQVWGSNARLGDDSISSFES